MTFPTVHSQSEAQGAFLWGEIMGKYEKNKHEELGVQGWRGSGWSHLKHVHGYFTEDGHKLCFIDFQGRKGREWETMEALGFGVEEEEAAVKPGTREVQTPTGELWK